MDNHQLQWSRGYGDGIFTRDGEQIASDVGTVELPEDFREEHYRNLSQFWYSPDFTSYTPLGGYALHNGQYYNISVQLSTSANDFRAANEGARFAEKPAYYTWHHLFDADGNPNILQLVNTVIHQRSCPHVGGNRQHLLESNVGHQVLAVREDWLICNHEVRKLLEKLAEKKIGLKKQFFLREERPILSCQLLFSGESAADLIDSHYLWEGSPLEQYVGLHPVGLDFGGDVIVADQHGDLYILSHETNEIETLHKDALNLEEFLGMLTGEAVGDL